MKKLYLDFDGVIVNTNLIFDEILQTNNVDMEDLEAKRLFLSRLDFSTILS